MQRSLIALALMAALACPAIAADSPATADATQKKSYKPDEPIAKVNGVAIPAIFAEFVRQNRAARNMPMETMTLETLRSALVGTELLVQDAVKKGLDKDPNVAAALEFQRKELLGKAAVEKFASDNPVSEELVKEEYEKAKAKAGEKEYRASHILVATEKEANDLLAKLKNRKTKFEDLAKKHSKDSSAGNGGDLGWTVPANLVPEFAQAMTALKKGETSKKPVQTQFGWHILRLADMRDLDFPPYEQLKGRIASQLQQQAIHRYVQALRAEAKVE